MTITIEPYVGFYAVEETRPPVYGVAGKIAVIGAFPTNTFQVDIFTRAEDAKAAIVNGTNYKVPGDNSAANASKTVVPDTYKAFYALDYYFAHNAQSTGPEYVLIVNTNYQKETIVTSSSNTDIANACTNILSEEDFDILSIAEPTPIAITVDETLTLNPTCNTIKAFADSQFFKGHPFGLITGFDMTGATTDILTAFQNLFNTSEGGVFKAVTTPNRINGDASSLTIEQSGAWQAAYTSGRAVNKSETNKQYPTLIGEDSKTVFPSTGTISYSTLINKGFHTIKYKNRQQKTIKCINNVTPKLYDMKIERIRNYIMRRFQFEDELGEDNAQITKDVLIGMCEREKNNAIAANYIVDMEYSIKPVSTEKVRIDLKLYIPDIIRAIDVYVEVKVSDYMEGD